MKKLFKNTVLCFAILCLPLTACQVEEEKGHKLDPNDSILTYKVEIEEPYWVGWHNDGTKLYAEEFLRDNPDASESEIEKAEHIIILNSFNGLPWDEAVLSGIKNGVMQHDDYADDLCRYTYYAWAGQDKYIITLPNDLFLKRMQTQMKMINAVPFENPVIRGEYISYFFKTGDSPFLSGRHHHRPSFVILYNKVFQEDLERIRDKEIHDFAIKMRPKMKEYLSKTGIGKGESFGDQTVVKLSKVQDEKNMIRVDFPVTKKGFIGFYENLYAQTPPQHLYEFIEFYVSLRKKRHNIHLGLSSRERATMSKEQKEDIYQIKVKERDEIYQYNLEFINAQRSIGYSYSFSRSSGVKNDKKRTDWLLRYNVFSEYSKNEELKNVQSYLQCHRTALMAKTSRAENFLKPYFLKYPQKQFGKCRPYMRWFHCHVEKMSVEFLKCKDVPIDEPEMCE